MYKVDDVIIYGTQGVCRIEGVEEKTVSGIKKSYYVLRPVNDPGSTIFAPIGNEHILKKMRRLLTREEIIKLIDSMPEEDTVWLETDNDRKEHYKKVLASGEPAELVKIIKSIYLHKKHRESAGKRLHMIDEHFFREAEQILYNEFQYVLNLKDKEEMIQFIFSRIESR